MRGLRINNGGWIFVVFFFSIAFFSGIWLFNIQDYVPLSSYEYNFRTSNLNLRDVSIQHDFSKSKGEISFNITAEDFKGIESEIFIGIPDVTQLEVFQREEGYKKKVKYQKTGNQISIIVFPPKNIQSYVIYYDSSIKPHGRFTIDHVQTEFRGYEGRLSFDLGRKYLCSQLCIEDLKNTGFNYKNSEKKIRLNLNYGAQEHYFILNAYRDIRLCQGLALGFFVSSLMILLELLFETICAFFSKEKRKNKEDH
ncbi:hypothetical protein HYX13_04030 [Candidatus Woesearchaeota archaeon]|nr:hypothetical protein [Candidatus Woesearchaeota archaeon]